MFTLLELTNGDWNYIGLALNMVSDAIFFGALYWAYYKGRGEHHDR